MASAAETSGSTLTVDFAGELCVLMAGDELTDPLGAAEAEQSPVRLEDHVPYLLEHGTTVHLGGPEASFTYVFGGKV